MAWLVLSLGSPLIRCPAQSNANGFINTGSVISVTCRPSMIASTTHGASNVSRSTSPT